MHEQDLAIWREIDQGGRRPTWAAFIGTREGSTYLTPSGQAVRQRLVDDFESLFGTTWLATAMPGPQGGRIPQVGRFSPVFSLRGDEGAAASFIELVRWWASFKTQQGRPGFKRILKDLRADITPTRLHHTLSQVRLGAVASMAGYGVEYEIATGGDVKLSGVDSSVTIEVFAMGVGDEFAEKERTSDRMFGFLDQVARVNGVYFEGDLPPTDADLDAWMRRVQADASVAAQLGIAVSLEWDGATLHVGPGSSPEGTQVRGPALEGDVGSRLWRRARRKASQVKDSDAGWLWIENHGAIDALVPVHSLALERQLEAYASLFAGALDGVDAAKGITFSTARRAYGRSRRRRRNSAMRRPSSYRWTTTACG